MCIEHWGLKQVDTIGVKFFMHPPLTVVHEECVRFVNDEIIHLLGFLNIPSQPDNPGRTIGLTYLIARPQVSGVRPAFTFHVDGMFSCRFNAFAVFDEFGKDGKGAF